MSGIILSPHLDDAAISAWTALRHARAVVNVFTDSPTGVLGIWDKVCGFTDSGDVAALRKAEDVDAMATLGLRPHYLDFQDEAIRRETGEPVPDAGTLADEIGRVVHQIESSFPGGKPYETSRVSILAPLGGGPKPHPDHVLVRDAAIALHRADRIRLALYADQPYVYKGRAWPEWALVDGGAKYVHDREAADSVPLVEVGDEADHWRRFPRAVPDMVALDHGRAVVVLDPDERAEKLAFMQRYATQYENLNRRLRTKNLLRDPGLYGVEVFWNLDPPAPTMGGSDAS